jgi:hypothetical protein
MSKLKENDFTKSYKKKLKNNKEKMEQIRRSKKFSQEFEHSESGPTKKYVAWTSNVNINLVLKQAEKRAWMRTILFSIIIGTILGIIISNI